MDKDRQRVRNRVNFGREFAENFKTCYRVEGQEDCPQYDGLVTLGEIIYESPANLLGLFEKYKILGNDGV
jgi:hypothetical protein